MPESDSLQLIILGASGHGRVVADAALSMSPTFDIVGMDDAPERVGRAWFGSLVCKSTQDLPQALERGARIHLAIGLNTVRERVAVRLGLVANNQWASIVHPCAVAAASATWGSGSLICAGSVLAPYASVGRGAIINHNAVVDHDVVVDDFAHIAPSATLGGGVRIGKRVLVGANAVVLPGTRIANDVVIGAGAVVTRDISEPGSYAGAPARMLR